MCCLTERGLKNCLKTLIELGGDLNEIKKDDPDRICSPLVSALMSPFIDYDQKLELIGFLIHKGANVNLVLEQDEESKTTAISYLSSPCSVNFQSDLSSCLKGKVAILLIESGADVEPLYFWFSPKNVPEFEIDTDDNHLRQELLCHLINRFEEVEMAKHARKLNFSDQAVEMYSDARSFAESALRNMDKTLRNANDQEIDLKLNYLSKAKDKLETVLKEDGTTALMCAAQLGYKKTVQLLLKLDAEINAVDNKNSTALVYAACGNHLEIVQLLFHKGACCEREHTKRIEENGIKNPSTFLLKKIIELKASIKNLKGGILEKSEYEVVNLSLKILDKYQLAPMLILPHLEALTDDFKINLNKNLIESIKLGCNEIVKFLISLGANICATDESGMTALMFAAEKGHQECVEILLDLGADLNKADLKDKTALMHVQKGHSACEMTLMNATIAAFKKRTQFESFYFPPKGPLLDTFMKQTFNVLEDSQTTHLTALLKQGFDISWGILDSKPAQESKRRKKKSQKTQNKSSADTEEKFSHKQETLHRCKDLFEKLQEDSPLKEKEVEFFKAQMSLHTRYQGKAFSEYLNPKNLGIALIDALDLADFPDEKPLIKSYKIKRINAAILIQKIKRGKPARKKLNLQKKIAALLQNIIRKRKLTEEQQELIELRLKDRARKAYEPIIKAKKDQLFEQVKAINNIYQHALVSADRDLEAVRKSITCSLSLAIMTDPVVSADGHTYERAAIEKWFGRNNTTSPNTNEKLEHLMLVPNFQIRQLCDAFRNLAQFE